jgi:hypothetical protein
MGLTKATSPYYLTQSNIAAHLIVKNLALSNYTVKITKDLPTCHHCLSAVSLGIFKPVHDTAK